MATITTLVSFDGTNGETPFGGLIADAQGDLFGTTSDFGSTPFGPRAPPGTVFEIVKTAGGYAGAPTTLVSFNGTNGAGPTGGLIADAQGDLFGTTTGYSQVGGLATQVPGTVFEIAKTAGGYAGTPTTLVTFNGPVPHAGLIADAQGDLFGTTAGGGGTVFEIAKTAGGYASTATTLVSFNGANGYDPFAGLIADAQGDLFGTTTGGGANGDGTVFEIAKTAGGYVLTTLVSFNGTNGQTPEAGLIADAQGDLFGTTSFGGANDDGTVFEIAKTVGGYASTPTTLVNFDNAHEFPQAGLIADAQGDLFGTTAGGSGFTTPDFGTVFEIAKTAGGYAGTPTYLVSFAALNGVDGSDPQAGLIAGAQGDLFGTAAFGGTSDDGTVFEVSDAGFALPTLADTIWGAGNDDTVSGVGTTISSPQVFNGSNRAINGGSGTPALIGVAGSNNVLLGGDVGNDTIWAAGNTVSVTDTVPGALVGTSGNDDTVSAGPGANTIWASGSGENISGNSGNDLIGAAGDNNSISGGSGGNTIWTSGNGETITGGAGHDVIGSAGNSSLVTAGGGNDTIYASGNNDTIAGGGNALIEWSGANHLFLDTAAVYSDTVVGFDQAGGDRIHLTGGHTASSSVTNGGMDTLITLSDHSTILLKYVNDVNNSFFS